MSGRDNGLRGKEAKHAFRARQISVVAELSISVKKNSTLLIGSAN